MFFQECAFFSVTEICRRRVTRSSDSTGAERFLGSVLDSVVRIRRHDAIKHGAGEQFLSAWTAPEIWT